MEKITSASYIRLQRKLCNPKIIITANKLASEWGITAAEACYRLLNESLMREYNKRLSDKK